MDAEDLIVGTFQQVGIDAKVIAGSAVAGGSVLPEPVVLLGGRDIELVLKRRSLVNDAVVEQLLKETRGRTLFIVAERITGSARKQLTARGSGYLDLRGRLALRTGNVLIDIDVDPIKKRPDRADALGGKAGLEVAVALLLDPESGASVRGIARDLGRSPGTVSEVLKGLRDGGLIDESNRVVGTDLFWEVADRWETPQTLVADLPDPQSPSAKALRLGLDEEVGWSTVGSAPASELGASIVARKDQLVEFYVPDAATVRRALTLLGVAPTLSSAKASVRVAPVAAVLEHRAESKDRATKWRSARPLFIALDLAQDHGRGQEILDGWTPKEAPRVW